MQTPLNQTSLRVWIKGAVRPIAARPSAAAAPPSAIAAQAYFGTCSLQQRVALGKQGCSSKPVVVSLLASPKCVSAVLASAAANVSADR